VGYLLAFAVAAMVFAIVPALVGRGAAWLYRKLASQPKPGGARK
jgi:hypothetical protein